MATSLMDGCAKAGIHYVACAPPELSPAPGMIQHARESAEKNGSTVTVVAAPREAMVGANVIYTDVWASMGEEAKLQERIRLLNPYQVNMEMLRWTGNVEKGKVIFLHCLPAFHDHQTELTRDIGALEVTDDVFEAPFSRVFDEAENRVHTIKALMVATLTGGGGQKPESRRRYASPSAKAVKEVKKKTGDRKKG